jgi:hypothetical protein
MNVEKVLPSLAALTIALVTMCLALPGVAAAVTPAGSGYWMLGSDGSVYAFGTAQNCGTPSPAPADSISIVAMPDGLGYWTLDTSGFVEAFECGSMPSGDLVNYEGSNFISGSFRSGEYAISMSALPDGTGYWVFTNFGRAISFGKAGWYGDMSNVHLNGGIIGSVATPSGHGYYMVATDGGIFTFGDARFHGSMGAAHLNAQVVSMAPTPDGGGYWLVAFDGGIFSFGDARFYGSMGAVRLNRPIEGIVASPTGHGYLMVAADGGIFTFGDVPFHGSLGSHPPAFPIWSIAVMPRGTVIQYQVTGNGTADVTYEGSGSAIEQQTVHLPWTYALPAPPDFPTVSAQLNGTGSISCAIIRNGVVVARAHSSGAYVIADCS